MKESRSSLRKRTRIRDHRFNALLSSEEYLKLKTLADSRGLSMSDYIRQFIRRDEYNDFKVKPKDGRSK